MAAILLALQVFHVVFLLLHDWVPLGRLNDVCAVRRANPGASLFRTTLLSMLPYCICLAGSVVYWGKPYPGWLVWWLWGSYGLLFLGELRAWWIPYLFVPDGTRAARYAVMFGNTHAFLPARNGIQPNTLHVVLHVATALTLVVLGILTLR